MKKFRIAALPLGAGLLLIIGSLIYCHVTQPLLARTEAAKLICESTIIQSLSQADSIMNEAQNNGGKISMESLLRRAQELQTRLVEMNQLIQARATKDDAGGRALRGIASLDAKARSEYSSSTADLALHRCPDRVHDREKAIKGAEAIAAVVKSLPK